MPLSLRPGTQADSPALSKICLLTGNFGTSAEHLLSKPELLGVVYAEPYVAMPGCYAFVLVDTSEAGDREEVVGYIIGAYDTPSYEEAMAKEWFPLLAEKYPVGGEGTELDKHFYGLFAKPHKTGKDVTAVYPSHFHIDMLAPYQRAGWGRKMVDTVVQHLRGKGYKGVWAGIDSRNEEGRKWYRKLGFRKIDSEQGEYWVMDFDRWDGRVGMQAE